jgi:hypothetical protein
LCSFSFILTLKINFERIIFIHDTVIFSFLKVNFCYCDVLTTLAISVLIQVQNADDNIYPQSVEPTLVFILQETGITVLNNELGFTAQNIKALCDVGNSTKKGSNAGYIGNKGIGFKSVFRVYCLFCFLF